ncbi:MAG: PaaI family thioesterase [Syntrophobacterales bacterium]|nr:MAG: PaaI family thioesterase [Syntrophobacterales bacterium]
METLPSCKVCFVCGKENRHGLRIQFFADHHLVRGTFKALDFLCGYPRIVHGGIMASVADEVMWWAASWKNASPCVTVELNVKYLKPASTDQEYELTAQVVKQKKRIVEVEGEVRDKTGQVYAAAWGKYLLYSGAKKRETMQVLDFKGCSEEVRGRYVKNL